MNFLVTVIIVVVIVALLLAAASARIVKQPSPPVHANGRPDLAES